MSKVLGLDLGTNSIGWAIVNNTENKKELLGDTCKLPWHNVT